MRIFGKKRIRRRHFRKAVWIAISAVAALGMVFFTIAPAFGNLGGGAPAKPASSGNPAESY